MASCLYMTEDFNSDILENALFGRRSTLVTDSFTGMSVS